MGVLPVPARPLGRLRNRRARARSPPAAHLRTDHAFDISRASLAHASWHGSSGCADWRDDFNAVRLPAERYDIVFFHGSLHHVSDPDRLLREVHKTLKPHGLLFIDEYVGPSRDEWTEDDLRFARAEYDQLPDSFKRYPLAAPVAPGDPSEMIRSSRIIPAIRAQFEVVHYRPYWGNLLHPLFCALKGERLLEPENAPLIERWVRKEQDLVAAGEIAGPLYAVALARKPESGRELKIEN